MAAIRSPAKNIAAPDLYKSASAGADKKTSDIEKAQAKRICEQEHGGMYDMGMGKCVNKQRP